MKQFVYKILSAFLALIVLFSSLSFTIEKHMCGETIASVSYFGHADSCGMETMDVCENPLEVKIEKKSCCNDITQFVKGNDIEQKAIQKFELKQVQFVTAFVYSYINTFEGVKENIIPFKDYTPPIIVEDIQLLDEVFII